MWGDAVKIQTDASELSLCEVEVYAEAYDGNTQQIYYVCM